MPRKKRKKTTPAPSKHPEGPPASLVLARFYPGCQVRVRPGVRDPNFPDFPLGGWTGTIQDVDRRSRPTLYLIAWDRRTLDAMLPTFRARCEHEGLDLETMWLGDDDLEPNSGALVPIERPGALMARPLDDDDPEDRVRAIFGLSTNVPLPDVSPGTLHTYHRWLVSRLSFPFAALHHEGGLLDTRFRPVLVTGLVPAEQASVDEGLLVEARRGDDEIVLSLAEIELEEESPAAQEVADYAHWLQNAGPGPSSPFGAPAAGERVAFGKLLGKIGLGGAAAGSLVGAVLAAVAGGRTGIAVAALALGGLGLLLGAKFGLLFRFTNRPRSGRLFAAGFGLVAGAAAGAVVGATVAAFVGTILGSIAGTLLGQALAGLGSRPLGGLAWALLGGWVGGLGLAYWSGPESALSGAVSGALVGGVLAVLLAVIFLTAVGLAMNAFKPK